MHISYYHTMTFWYIVFQVHVSTHLCISTVESLFCSLEVLEFSSFAWHGYNLTFMKCFVSGNTQCFYTSLPI